MGAFTVLTRLIEIMARPALGLRRDLVLGTLIEMAGIALTKRADVLADRTGLGEAIVGAVLLGIAGEDDELIQFQQPMRCDSNIIIQAGVAFELEPERQLQAHSVSLWGFS